MTFVLFIAAVAGLMGALVYARNASLILTTLLALVVGYVFGHSFWNMNVGPIPLTLDRVMLLGIAGLFVWRLRWGKLSAAPLAIVDWGFAVVLVWLTFSTLTSQPEDSSVLPKSPYWRLLVSFWTPAFLFAVTRCSPLNDKTIRWFLIALAGLGSYLALTALAETAGVWSVVFPRYIADPEQGLHFGRARGPALNSVSLGVYLSICLWAAWLVAPRLPHKLKMLFWLATPVMAFGVLLTYTRSTWIGLALSGLVVLAWHLPKRKRVPVLTAVIILGLVFGIGARKSLLQLEREDSGGVSQHSVQQRTAFAYVSWKMFKDNPLLGVGFGRFYDQKLPYLSDRTQTFELESIRDLHHHNTFLGLLVETGMVGLAAYLAVLAGLLTSGWRLANNALASPDMQRLGIMLVATVSAYLPSALFHDLTHVHSDQWLVFLIAGVAYGCERRLEASVRATQHAPATRPVALGGVMHTGMST